MRIRKQNGLFSCGRLFGVKGDVLITDSVSYRKLNMDVFEEVKLNLDTITFL